MVGVLFDFLGAWRGGRVHIEEGADHPVICLAPLQPAWALD